VALDFEEIWHTHRRFILQVGAGALAFAILLVWQQSIEAEAATLSKKNASEQAALQDDLSGLEGAEGLEKGRADALEEKLQPAVLDALLWEPDEGFTLPQGDKAPALFYAAAAGKAAEDVKAHAARWNATVPQSSQDLGLTAEPEEARVPEGLAQADLARRLVVRLLDAGVRAVSRVELPEVAYVAREGGEGGKFLRATPATVHFRASAESLSRALGELLRDGRSFVEVLGCKVTRVAARGGGDPLEVELSVQALSLVDQAPVAPVNEDQPRNGRRGPRRFGRER
jgi:hypothetical protein